jgi:hypothetical protein
MAWIGPVVQGVMGLGQIAASSQAGNQLPEPKRFTPTPQMKRAEAMAERRAEKGFSDAERANFEQMLARRTSSAKRAMQNIGLAGIAPAMSNIFNIDATNQFAAQSEAERRKGEVMYAGIAGQMQGIQDRETTSFNQMLQQSRTALGQAGASGFKNITGAFGMAAQQANTNKLAEAYMNSGDTYNFGTGTTPTTPATTTPVAVPPVPAATPMGYSATAPGVAPAGTFEAEGTPFLPSDGSLDYSYHRNPFASDTEPRFSPTVNPFGTEAETRAFQDYANTQAGYDITDGYGWGPATSSAYGMYGQGYRNR